MSENLKTKKRKRIFAFVRLFFGITRDFWKETRLMRRLGTKVARDRMSNIHRRRAMFFRDTALQMGGVLIKLGQFLGTRADVMPEEYLQELAKLQDEVPPAEFPEVKALIEEEFGKPLSEIFVEFNERPVAAASLAQVHKAKLPTGESVAVKVQRPQIEAYINIDLGIFSYLMDGLYRFTQAGRRYDIPALVREFALTLGDELDFYREGFYAERFKANFESSEIIRIPSIYWAYTRNRVLTLEAVDGIKIWDFEALETAGVDRSEVAYEVLQSFLKMVLEDGFFHADPHPGNLFVVPGPLITFVDFGMVGQITPEMKELFKEGAIAGVRRDVDSLVSSLTKLGFIRRGADLRPIKNTIVWIFENYSGMSAKELDFEKLEVIQEDLRRIMYEQPFTISSEFAFLGRAAGTLIGLITGLDPEFDFIESVKPYVQNMISEMKPPLYDMIAEEAKNLSKILLNLPKQVQNVLTKAEKGELRTRIDTTEIVDAINRSNRARFTTALSIIFASLIIGGVLLVSNGHRFLSSLMFVFAFFSLLGFFLTLREPRFHHH